jgi:hypothetical protein
MLQRSATVVVSRRDVESEGSSDVELNVGRGYLV